jgi:hypothetical protein
MALGVAGEAAARSGGACGEACLNGFIDAYLGAILAHDPARLPTAATVKFTENLVPLQLGREGLWATANGRRDFNIYVPDVRTGQAAWIGILKENDKPVMAAIRLKIVGGRITEAETLVGRSALNGADRVPGPRPQFAELVPPSERTSRERMIAIASSNWDAMEQGDGERAPYAADCERYDNGQKTTGRPPAPRAAGEDASAPADIGVLGCKGQMGSGRFRNGGHVRPRRVWAVDEDHGVVIGLYTPNVPGTARTVQVFGKPLVLGPDELIPFTIQQVEAFKIRNGQISRVEVVLGPRVPYGMRSPFDMKTLWEPR